jgi:hypothetical protein
MHESIHTYVHVIVHVLKSQSCILDEICFKDEVLCRDIGIKPTIPAIPVHVEEEEKLRRSRSMLKNK